MRQSQPQDWLSRSAVVNRNLRTIQSRLFRLLSPVSTAEAGFGEQAYKMYIYGSKQMTPSISVESISRLLLHPIAVSHCSVLIMFNNWRVCEAWKSREVRGEVQKLSFLHRPIPLSGKSITHSKSKKQVRATETVFTWDTQIGVN